MASDTSSSIDSISDWRSIVTLIVFVITNIVVLFPFHIPFFIPRLILDPFLKGLVTWRIIPPPQPEPVTLDDSDSSSQKESKNWITTNFEIFWLPLNFVTAPLIADLFLLAIKAIGRQEVHDGTLGAENIEPIDIMAFFITLAYIAISIDSSGLIRYLAFKVLQLGGNNGKRLFAYLYLFFFGLGSFIGNDPIILSGTAFLAYMTRVSNNIRHPRAWIYAQFAVANVASAILVSSNPTNLVLAGAFNIKFVDYTRDMIVPVIVTAALLLPFLIFVVFNNEDLIPKRITMHEPPKTVQEKKAPVNPNIPNARGAAEEKEKEDFANDTTGKLLSLEEIMNPFIDTKGAAFGGIIMAATLITLLIVNATGEKRPVFYTTVPAAFVLFVWDISFGWLNRKGTRKIAEKGKREKERIWAEKKVREAEEKEKRLAARHQVQENGTAEMTPAIYAEPGEYQTTNPPPFITEKSDGVSTNAMSTLDEKQELSRAGSFTPQDPSTSTAGGDMDEESRGREFNDRVVQELELRTKRQPWTVTSKIADGYNWCRETFPTSTVVISHLPFALIPFAFCMFILVQALVTKGWVQVFAYGWDHWVNKTGVIGCIGGMGFLSVIFCNFAGTNIGTTILLSRVIQQWVDLHSSSGNYLTQREFWATVYSMALGVNFGAFSMAFSASLAGLLWRDILARKHIKVSPQDFMRVNLPIITFAMTIGLSVLIGEVYIFKPDAPYIT